MSASPLPRDLRAFLVEALARMALADVREAPGGSKSLGSSPAVPWDRHLFARSVSGRKNRSIGKGPRS